MRNTSLVKYFSNMIILTPSQIHSWTRWRGSNPRHRRRSLCTSKLVGLSRLQGSTEAWNLQSLRWWSTLGSQSPLSEADSLDPVPLCQQVGSGGGPAQCRMLGPACSGWSSTWQAERIMLIRIWLLFLTYLISMQEWVFWIFFP